LCAPLCSIKTEADCEHFWAPAACPPRATVVEVAFRGLPGLRSRLSPPSVRYQSLGGTLQRQRVHLRNTSPGSSSTTPVGHPSILRRPASGQDDQGSTQMASGGV